jgi:hypothetical protein
VPTGFSIEQTYVPVERKPREFQAFIEKMINTIEGEFPDSNPECYDCKFLYEIGYY